MIRGALVAALAFAACGDRSPIPAEPLRVAVGATEVAFGRAFPLAVVRTWDRAGATPPAWNDVALAPLAVRLEETTRRERDGRVEERRTYRAYAFAEGDLEVPGSGLRLTVTPALDRARPGPVEPPEGPLQAPLAWLRWTTGAVLLLAAAAVALRRRRRPAPAPAAPPAPDAPSPADGALRALAALRGRAPSGRADEQAFFVAAAGIVRRYLAARFGEGVQRSSEEVVAARGSDRLAGVLAACDRVKFARHAPTADECAGVLDEAVAYVRETAP